MVDYLKQKWQLLAGIAGLVVAGLVLVSLATGNDTATAPAQNANQNQNQAPAEPETDPSQQQENPADQDNNQTKDPNNSQNSPNQPFAVRIRRLDLEITSLTFGCLPLSDIAKEFAPYKTPEEIQAAFDRYEQGLSTLPQDEVWELYGIAGALDYMLNLKSHLSQNQSGGSISTVSVYQSLGLYKQCVWGLTAENKGDDHSFSNGCGLIIDEYVTASDDQGQQYQPLYLGPAIACTEAKVPFVNGDITSVRVVFSLPSETELTSATIQNGHPNSEHIVIELDLADD